MNEYGVGLEVAGPAAMFARPGYGVYTYFVSCSHRFSRKGAI